MNRGIAMRHARTRSGESYRNQFVFLWNHTEKSKAKTETIHFRAMHASEMLIPESNGLKKVFTNGHLFLRFKNACRKIINLVLM